MRFPQLPLGAFRSHLFGRDRCAVVAPGAALVVDDAGDFRIRECSGEWRHRTGVCDAADGRTLQSAQYDVDVACRVGIVDRRVAFERREDSGQTLAAGLMAGGARGGE